MQTLLDRLNFTVRVMTAIVSTAINLPLLIFLQRNEKAREDIVSMLMRSMTVLELVGGTLVAGFNALFIVVPSADVPPGLVTFAGSIQHIATDCFIVHLAAMSACKCYVITRPLTYFTVLTNRVINVLVAAIWIFNCVMIIGADLAGVQWVLDPTFHTSAPVGNPKPGRALRIFEVGVVHLVSMLIILVSFARMLIVVRQHHRAIDIQTATSTAEGQQSVHHGWTASIRSAKSLFIIVLALNVAYLPATANFQPDLVLPIWYMTMSTWLVTTSFVLNGILYILLYKSTRRDFGRMFFGRCMVSKVSPEATNEANQEVNH